MTTALMSGRRTKEVGNDRCGVDDLLEVVEDEQEPLVAQPVRERFGDRAGRPLRDAEGAGDPRCDEHRVADRLERDEEDPSGKSSAARAASWSDSLVLPVPPGPVSVSSRVSARKRAASSSSASRPMKVVSCVGRLFGRASSVRRAGNSLGRPSASTWKRWIEAVRSLSRWSPRSRRATPSIGSSTMRSRVSPETRIWPPCATAAIRAARLTLRPTKLSPVFSAPPEWSPIRTRSGASSGHGSASIARWASTAARIAAGASAKTTKNESPSVPCSIPPC